jgi:hypothetical protein
MCMPRFLANARSFYNFTSAQHEPQPPDQALLWCAYNATIDPFSKTYAANVMCFTDPWHSLLDKKESSHDRKGIRLLQVNNRRAKRAP